MHTDPNRPTQVIPDHAQVAAQQRLLEGWLPLAQEANRHYGWNLAGPDLERLIIAAEPALMHASTSLVARAVLWRTYYADTLEERSEGLRNYR